MPDESDITFISEQEVKLATDRLQIVEEDVAVVVKAHLDYLRNKNRDKVEEYHEALDDVEEKFEFDKEDWDVFVQEELDKFNLRAKF